MKAEQGVLIVGGYGVVGRRIARALAPDYPGQIVVGGRHADRAGLLAMELGHQVRATAIDVTQPQSIEAALHGIGTVVSCIDQPEPYLLHAAIEHGLGYTDITPHLMTQRPTNAMRDTAVRSGARVVLGAGLAPGVSSMLARIAVDRLSGGVPWLQTAPPGTVDQVTSAVLLSIGDTFGEASRGYILQELSRPYPVFVDGATRMALPLSQPKQVRFPAPLGARDAYLFPFSDQVFFPMTLGARTAVTRLALDPPWLGPVLSVLVRLRITALLARRRGGGPSQRIIKWLRTRYGGQDWYGLVVEVEGPDGSVRASLAGRGQAEITALGAAAIARGIIDGEVTQPGIWLAEQVIPPNQFLQHLGAKGVVPRVDIVGPQTAEAGSHVGEYSARRSPLPPNY